MKRLRRQVAGWTRITGLTLAVSAWEKVEGAEALPDPGKLPPASSKQVNYARDIEPIFENSCFRCHGPKRARNHLRLDSREGALKGGDDGGDVVAGDSGHSRMSFYVARLVEDKEMPPEGKGDPMTSEQMALIRAWIDQGANYAAGTNAVLEKFDVATEARFISVGGNAAKFREQLGLKEGWGGGIKSFSLDEKLPGDRSFHVEGRALFPDNDDRIELRIDQRGLGYVEGGWEQYRRYFNDVGGAYAGFSPSSYSLDKDLYLTEGKAWINFGLNRPDAPHLTLGYEYDYREGNKSLLEWGDVMPLGGDPRNIYPSFKDLNERTHILKLDFDHDFSFVRVNDQFRAEFYRLSDQRADLVAVTQPSPASGSLNLIQEGESHFQAANAFRVEKEIIDGWQLSAGHLYTRLSGDASFDQSLFTTPYVLAPPVFELTASDIVLNQESHTANLSSLFGPWKDLSISTGVQAEWMRQTAIGLEQIPPNAGTIPISGDIRKTMAEEDLMVRYEGLPYTVLSAEARLVQQSINYDGAESGGLYDFSQGTDADTDTREYRAGATISPWRIASLGFEVARKTTENNYNNLNHLAFGAPSTGYPGFIVAHDFATDEASIKLVLRPVRWLKATFSYRVNSTDYNAQGIPVTFNTLGDVSSGASIQSGVYNSHVYSASALMTPWQRVTLTETMSYFDSRIHTADNNIAAVAPYAGGTWLTQSQMTLALNAKNDLRLGYFFSQSNFGQDNAAAGLPLGLDYTWHGVKAGWVRHFAHNRTLSLEYNYYKYREPSTGGVNDYNAHAVFATFSMRWP